MQAINPHLLDVVKRDRDYALYYSCRPMTTQTGNEVAHQDPRLLEHILRELSVARVLDSRGLNSYSLFCAIDHFPSADDTLDEIMRIDPVIQSRSRRARPEASEESCVLLDCLDEGRLMSFYFSGICWALKSLNKLLNEGGHGGLELAEQDSNGFLDAVKTAFLRLTIEKRAAAISLCAAHEAGILLPLMLIQRRLTASEYANALFSIHLPAEMSARRGASCNDILATGLRKTTIKPDWKAPDASFSKLRQQAFMTMEYLSCFEREETQASTVRELIGMGEHFGVEFKSCLRRNLMSGKKDPAIEHACLKTIAAFLNSSGGTLLIGVRDDGSIEGIESDGFPHTDKFSLHFWNLVKSRLGQEICPFIRTTLETLDERTVCAVDCTASPSPVFLNQKQGEDEFYIRVGPSTARLTIREALKYIDQRFEKQQAAR